MFLFFFSSSSASAAGAIIIVVIIRMGGGLVVSNAHHHVRCSLLLFKYCNLLFFVPASVFAAIVAVGYTPPRRPFDKLATVTH